MVQRFTDPEKCQKVVEEWKRECLHASSQNTVRLTYNDVLVRGVPLDMTEEEIIEDVNTE